MTRVTDAFVGAEDGLREAALSTALITVFRGKFCDAILPNRKTVIFEKEQVIYDVGDEDRNLYFVRRGVVRVGTVTQDGHEVIYDVRKDGDVVGELCACEHPRLDRAVALEQTEAVPVPYLEVISVLQKQPDLIGRLVGVFCDALREAYEQVNTLAVDDVLHRLVKALLGLATKIGRRSGEAVELPTYLTQEEISQMVVARRERVSTALNQLRRQGMINYTNHGRLILNVKALESLAS